MLTFIIPVLVGTIVGFLIRGKPSDTFAMTTGRRVAWAIGFGFGGLLIGMPIGLAISSTTGPQIAGLIAGGLLLGVFNILSIENATYKKWSDKNALAWLIGGVFAICVIWFVLAKQRPDFSKEADNASASPALSTATSVEELAKSLGGSVIESTVPNTYLGISLGDSEQQVRYVLGEPQDKSTEKNRLMFLYIDKNIGDIGVWFVLATKKVQRIVCAEREMCPPFLGIKIGDEESKVKTILGGSATEKFQETSENDTQLTKVITLSNTYEVSFYLKRKKVVAIALSEL